MSPNIDTPKVETRSVTEERINKVLDVFSGTDWTSGFRLYFRFRYSCSLSGKPKL